MTEYLTYRDVPLLRGTAFNLSPSGASWFGEDKEGNEWQAFILDGDTEITFRNMETSLSSYLAREDFVEMFL